MQNENSVQLVALLIYVAAARYLVQKGRRDPQTAYLDRRQRIRPLLLEVLDPIFAVIVVGPVLAHELNINGWHLLAGLVGISLGVPVGMLRSRVQFVRAIKSSQSVVLTRSNAEYLLVAVLIVLRAAQDSIRQAHAPFVTVLFAGLLALPIGESAARSLSIVEKYRNSPDVASPTGLTP